MKNEFIPNSSENNKLDSNSLLNERTNKVKDNNDSKEINNEEDKDKLFLDSRTHSKNKSLNGIDLICFSHLRWNFVFQRPQHLLSRFAKKQRVFFIEEPIFEELEKPFLFENISNGI